uniref:Uncharacterized protein n=1 Tax=Megaselia scalaris TaxID=36166 RepID=T1GGE7_MEGSC
MVEIAELPLKPKSLFNSTTSRKSPHLQYQRTSDISLDTKPSKQPEFGMKFILSTPSMLLIYYPKTCISLLHVKSDGGRFFLTDQIVHLLLNEIFNLACFSQSYLPLCTLEDFVPEVEERSLSVDILLPGGGVMSSCDLSRVDDEDSGQQNIL